MMHYDYTVFLELFVGVKFLFYAFHFILEKNVFRFEIMVFELFRQCGIFFHFIFNNVKRYKDGKTRVLLVFRNG